MVWNWDAYFEKITDEDLFNDCIRDKKNYKNGDIELSYVETQGIPKGLLYSSRSGYFFKLSGHQDSILIDQVYLQYFYTDFLKKKKFNENNINNESVYFGFEFLLNLVLSRDTLSGIGKYKLMLIELKTILDKKTICFEGDQYIRSMDELNTFLKTKIFGFKTIKEELRFF